MSESEDRILKQDASYKIQNKKYYQFYPQKQAECKQVGEISQQQKSFNNIRAFSLVMVIPRNNSLSCSPDLAYQVPQRTVNARLNIYWVSRSVRKVNISFISSDMIFYYRSMP